jgi:hypothetical protein
MKTSVTLGSAYYTPAREESGWNNNSADLFLVEGSTEYHWSDIPQRQQEWAPESATKTQEKND